MCDIVPQFAGFMGVGMVIMLIFGIITVVARNKVTLNLAGISCASSDSILCEALHPLHVVLSPLMLRLCCVAAGWGQFSGAGWPSVKGLHGKQGFESDAGTTTGNCNALYVITSFECSFAKNWFYELSSFSTNNLLWLLKANIGGRHKQNDRNEGSSENSQKQAERFWSISALPFVLSFTWLLFLWLQGHCCGIEKAEDWGSVIPASCGCQMTYGATCRSRPSVSLVTFNIWRQLQCVAHGCRQLCVSYFPLSNRRAVCYSCY